MAATRTLAVVAVATLLGGSSQTPPAQTPRGDLVARYDAILESYRGGLVEAAVRELTTFTDDQINQVSDSWFPAARGATGRAAAQPDMLALAAMAHTDCALALFSTVRGLGFAPGRTIGPGPMESGMGADLHLTLARRLVEALQPTETGAGSFRRRWYLTALMALHRGQSRWDRIETVRDAALRAFPDDALILLEAGTIDEDWAMGFSPRTSPS